MLKLFISHSPTTQRSYAHDLKDRLTKYGIRGFVAHDDIPHGSEWLDELQASLEEMHALVFLSDLSGGQSAWCNQEIGFAVGSGKPVVTLLRGNAPLGLLAAKQGIRSHSNAVEDAAAIYKVLCKTESLLPVLSLGMAQQLGKSESYAQANAIAEAIRLHPLHTQRAIEKMEASQHTNGQVDRANDVPSAIESAKRTLARELAVQ